MKPCAGVFVLFTVILAVSPGAQGQTASELIEHAHKYDNMYVSSSDASQQKALEFYQAALRAGPDDKQQLHILYRMAQLYGSAYEVQKGEKPDFRKAIQLNEQIIDSYPPEEPLVLKATLSIADHYTTLWEFETALRWSKKALEYDTSELQEQIKAIEQRSRELEQREQARRESELRPGERTSDPMTREERLEFRSQRKRPRALEKTLECIKRYQQIAVDQVAYCGNLIDPLRAHGELRVIIAQHSGTFIAERARQRLEENMDRRPELWAPTHHVPTPSNSSLRAGGSSAGAISEGPKSIEPDPNIVLATAERQSALEPNTAESSQPDKHTPR